MRTECHRDSCDVREETEHSGQQMSATFTQSIEAHFVNIMRAYMYAQVRTVYSAD